MNYNKNIPIRQVHPDFHTSFQPCKKGRAEIIEDIVPLNNITLSLEVPEKIMRVYLPHERRSLILTQPTAEKHPREHHGDVFN